MITSFSRLAILTEKTSWIIPYAEELRDLLREKGYEVSMVFNHKDIMEPIDVVFILSYGKIVPREFLKRHMHNLVVHESKLPKGRGWSPLTWQILEGQNEIPITLFEAAEEVDAGRIYLQDVMHFRGHELVDELRKGQGEKTIELILRFIDNYEEVVANATEQQGEPTHYRRRRAEDSELHLDKTIREHFNLLRVVDNERYPAFFAHMGKKYILKIYKVNGDNLPDNSSD